LQKTWSLDLRMTSPPFFLLVVLSNLSASFFWKSCCDGDREGRSEGAGPLEVHKLTWGTRSAVRALKFDGGLRGVHGCIFVLIRTFTLLIFLFPFPTLCFLHSIRCLPPNICYCDLLRKKYVPVLKRII
jgi:hypothetical protein